MQTTLCYTEQQNIASHMKIYSKLSLVISMAGFDGLIASESQTLDMRTTFAAA